MHPEHWISPSLSPKGNLRLAITIQWLQNYSAEDDTISEISFLSTNSDDQDLSYFEETGVCGDDERGAPCGSGGLGRSKTHDPKKLASVMEDITNDGFTAPASSANRKVNKRASTGSFLRAYQSEAAMGNKSVEDGGNSRALKSASSVSEATSSGESAGHQRFEVCSQSAGPKAASFHRHTVDDPGFTDPASRAGVFDLHDDSPLDSPIDKEHYMAMLCSSDDEDDVATMPGWRRSLKGLFGLTPHQSYRNTPVRGSLRFNLSNLNPQPLVGTSNDSGVMECSVTSERIEAETDVNALRKLALRVLEEHGTVALLHYHMENKACRLRAKLEAANMVSASLKERLLQAQSAEAGAQNGSDDLTTSLAQSKIKLADSEYRVLELKGELNKERERSHKLMAKLTKLETKYHIEREASYNTAFPTDVPSPTDVLFGPSMLDSPMSC
mmetsp:Transcript_17602/g.49198  ORF Transcript_17602/g.49198 Transcript_17602/m.49198 type:complete len:442 (+) Transcript_17602:1245-2570(+)